MIKVIFEKDEINKDIFYQATGMKKTKAGVIQKIPGSAAKYFENFEMGHVYPLLKTHKLTPEQVLQCTVEDIPIRLVQA